MFFTMSLKRSGNRQFRLVLKRKKRSGVRTCSRQPFNPRKFCVLPAKTIYKSVYASAAEKTYLMMLLTLDSILALFFISDRVNSMNPWYPPTTVSSLSEGLAFLPEAQSKLNSVWKTVSALKRANFFKVARSPFQLGKERCRRVQQDING